MSTQPVLGSSNVAIRDFSKAILPQQYPTWNDGSGWNQPQHYRTIQLADIDGDGKAELIGRGPGGVETYHWGDAHIWEALSLKGPFSDADGWDSPDHYMTILLADIDGDGKAELVGRSKKGLQVYYWNTAARNWDAISLAGPLPDEDRWSAQWDNFQAVDINGKGKVDIVVRVGYALRTYHWVPDAKKWDVSADDTQYKLNWFQFADIDGDGKAELVGNHETEIRTARWDGKLWQPLGRFPSGLKLFQDSPQLADIDGDGKAELIGRSTDRKQVVIRGWAGNDWHTKIYDEIGFVWEDAEGTTVQFADIDGDGKAEAIMRSPRGLEAFGWNGTTFNRIAAPEAGIMSDAEGWNQPGCYLTIQAANLGAGGQGFRKFAIVGRGPDGVQTWQWGANVAAATRPDGKVNASGFRTSVTNGFYQPSEPAFPDYSKNPRQLLAYKILSQYALTPNPSWPFTDALDPARQDIRARYTDRLLEGKWATMATLVSKTVGQPPAEVSPQDFEIVRSQIYHELLYVDAAYTWFKQTNDVLQRLFGPEALTVEIVAKRIDMPVNTAQVILDWLSMAALIVGAIAALAIVAFAPEAVPIIAACTAMLSTSLHMAGTAVGGDNSLKVQILELQEKLLANWLGSAQANDQLLQVYVQQWGLLKALSEPIVSGKVTWPIELTDKMVAQARWAYELTLWQTLTAIKWMVVGHKSAQGSKYEYDFVAVPGDIPLHYFLSVQYWSGVAGLYYDVPVDKLDFLFGPRNNNDPGGPLGVPLWDVIASRNGWRLPYDVDYNPGSPAVPDYLKRHRGNPVRQRVA